MDTKMTIEEAIKHARQKAKEMRILSSANHEGIESCIRCAAEHEQLAEWLEEYKELKDRAEPKKPIVNDIIEPMYDGNGCQVDAIWLLDARCPVCGEDLTGTVDCEFDELKELEINYCSGCGQAIDWSGEDE